MFYVPKFPKYENSCIIRSFISLKPFLMSFKNCIFIIFLSFHPFCHFRSCEYRVGKSTRCLVLIRFGVINYVLVARRKNIFFTILYCIFALCRLKVWKIWLLFAEHFTIKKTNTHDTHALYTIVSTGKLLKTVPQTHNH